MQRLKVNQLGYINRPPLTRARVETIHRLLDIERAHSLWNVGEVEALEKWTCDMLEYFDRKNEISIINTKQWQSENNFPEEEY